MQDNIFNNVIDIIKSKLKKEIDIPLKGDTELSTLGCVR